MTIRILKPGIFATVQDKGRINFQQYGVIVGGVMDSEQAQQANALVGNSSREAVLEITQFGTSFQAETSLLLAITGAHLQATIDGKPAPFQRPFVCHAQQIIRFNGGVGVRAYVAVAGGIHTTPVLGSRSTYVQAKLGGLHGNVLQAGDELPIGPLTPPQQQAFQKFQQPPTWYAPPIRFAPQVPVQFIPSSEWHLFTQKSQHAFLQETFSISLESNRMGYRLNGPSLHVQKPTNRLSQAVTKGTIQVPPNGQPIILLADRQTTGGYPIIGHVIAAHLDRLAQYPPQTPMRFASCTLKQAEDLLVQQLEEQQEVVAAIRYKFCH